MRTENTTEIFLCIKRDCRHEIETVSRYGFIVCDWCGSQMFPIQGSEKPIPDYRGMVEKFKERLATP